MPTWIVAADSSRARIFEALSPEKRLREIEDLVNPEGRANNRELASDAQGRYNAYGDRNRHHTAGPAVTPVDHETELFSKRVSSYLDKARNAHQYDRLYVVAPPKFLGLLRRNLSKEVQKLVVEEIDKDLSWFDEREIDHFLDRFLKENDSKR